MSWIVVVENIKCGGCARSIDKALAAIPGVTGLSVDVETNEVTVEADEAVRPAVVARLRELGYSERGAVAGAANVVAKARSFVSCAVGRVS